MDGSVKIIDQLKMYIDVLYALRNVTYFNQE